MRDPTDPERQAAELAQDVHRLPEPDDWPNLTLEETVRTWRTLNEAERILRTVQRAWSHQAAAMLRHSGEASGYEIDGHPVHQTRPVRTQWDGYGVLAALRTRMVDPNGELVDAIPTSVLAEVIPGVIVKKTGQPGTWSNWAVTALRNLDIDPDDYRTREWGPPEMKEGPGR